MQWQVMAIKDLTPAAYNPRVPLTTDDPVGRALRKSLDQFGCVEPPVFNRRSGTLVAGHQRVAALAEMGVSEIETVIVDLVPEQERALNLALNKISGHWDEAKLAKLLDELVQVPDFDLGVTGFELPDVRKLFADHLTPQAPAGTDEFDVDAHLASAGPPVTQRGDLIELGEHRLMCGDAQDPADVRRLMNGERAVLFATDPPYLVGYDGTNHPGGGASKNKDWSGSYGVEWDDARANTELYERFIAAAVAEAIVPSAAWYCWHASRRQAMLEAAWLKAGAFVHQQIIWVKNRPVLTRSWYPWQHEPCLFGWIKGHKPAKVTDPHAAPQSTVWVIDTLANGPERPDHPTPKPLEVFEIPMRQHTRRGDVCYEPFAGSGTQLIAAQRLGRRCMAMEISPVYCDLIVRRYMAMVGPEGVSADIAARYAKTNTAPSTREQPSPAAPTDAGTAAITGGGQ